MLEARRPFSVLVAVFLVTTGIVLFNLAETINEDLEWWLAGDLVLVGLGFAHLAVATIKKPIWFLLAYCASVTIATIGSIVVTDNRLLWINLFWNVNLLLLGWSLFFFVVLTIGFVHRK